MGWESSEVFRFDLAPPPPPSRSNDGLLALVSCIFGVASVLRCVGLVSLPCLLFRIHKKHHNLIIIWIFKNLLTCLFTLQFILNEP